MNHQQLKQDAKSIKTFKQLIEYQLKKLDEKRVESNIKYAKIVVALNLALSMGAAVVIFLTNGFSFLVLVSIIILSLFVTGVFLRNEYSTIAFFIYILIDKIVLISIGGFSTRNTISGILVLAFLYGGIFGMLKYRTVESAQKLKEKRARKVFALIASVLALAYLISLVYFFKLKLI